MRQCSRVTTEFRAYRRGSPRSYSRSLTTMLAGKQDVEDTVRQFGLSPNEAFAVAWYAWDLSKVSTRLTGSILAYMVGLRSRVAGFYFCASDGSCSEPFRATQSPNGGPFAAEKQNTKQRLFRLPRPTSKSSPGLTFLKVKSEKFGPSGETPPTSREAPDTDCIGPRFVASSQRRRWIVLCSDLASRPS